MTLVIRDETAADAGPIGDVTVAAFATLPVSGHTEQFIIAALRVAGALTISLVAELEGQVVGHIAFSPVTVDGQFTGWYGLGPLAVAPAHQRQGIGRALVEEGLARLRQLGARGCCLVGHPEYYRRLGFDNFPGLLLEHVPPEVFLAQTFDGAVPQGVVEFHEAFGATGP
ncbi:MAG: N-acetyltransferase [Armatimonadetes bacterium]|nr:N-acetyltransferase [Armatimonadota bacterium]